MSASINMASGSSSPRGESKSCPEIPSATPTLSARRTRASTLKTSRMRSKYQKYQNAEREAVSSIVSSLCKNVQNYLKSENTQHNNKNCKEDAHNTDAVHISTGSTSAASSPTTAKAENGGRSSTTLGPTKIPDHEGRTSDAEEVQETTGSTSTDENNGARSQAVEPSKNPEDEANTRTSENRSTIDTYLDHPAPVSTTSEHTSNDSKRIPQSLKALARAVVDKMTISSPETTAQTHEAAKDRNVDPDSNAAQKEKAINDWYDSEQKSLDSTVLCEYERLSKDDKEQWKNKEQQRKSISSTTDCSDDYRSGSSTTDGDMNDRKRFPQEKLDESNIGDSDSKGKRKKQKRTTYSEAQVEMLNASFQKERYPSYEEVTRLATLLGYEETQIRVWFQNKRAATTGTRQPKRALNQSQLNRETPPVNGEQARGPTTADGAQAWGAVPRIQLDGRPSVFSDQVSPYPPAPVAFFYGPSNIVINNHSIGPPNPDSRSAAVTTVRPAAVSPLLPPSDRAATLGPYVSGGVSAAACNMGSYSVSTAAPNQYVPAVGAPAQDPCPVLGLMPAHIPVGHLGRAAAQIAYPSGSVPTQYPYVLPVSASTESLRNLPMGAQNPYPSVGNATAHNNGAPLSNILAPVPYYYYY